MNSKILLTGLVLASLATGNVFAEDSNIGIGNTSNGDNGFVLGVENKADSTATSSFTAGYKNHTSGANTITAGYSNTISNANNLTVGTKNTVSGTSSLVGGHINTNKSNNSLVVGMNNTIKQSAENSLVSGENHNVSARSSSVSGYKNTVEGQYNNVSGYGNIIKDSASSVQVSGYGNEVSAKNVLVSGIENKAHGENSFVGGEYSQALGRDTFVFGSGAQAKKDYSIAIGTQAISSAHDTITIGNGSEANGVSSVVLGRTNKVNGDNTTVLGSNNGTVDAGQSVITGYNNKVLDGSKEQLVYGSNSLSQHQGAITVGTHAQTLAIDAVSLGNNTLSEVQNGVALGTNSTTDEAVSTASAVINGRNYTFAGGTANSTVSVGTNGKAGLGGVTEFKRTVTNVAAGRISDTSTDAINGSQLHSVIQEVGRNGQNIKDLAVGVQMLGDVVQDNVTNIAANTALANQALAEAQKKPTVHSGINTKVAAATNSDGSISYTVNVNRDLENLNSAGFGRVTDPVHSVITPDKAHFFNNEVNTSVGSDGVKLENTDNLDTASYTMDGMQASSNGKDIRFSTEGINAGNQIINGVKAGVADTDAVNVSQLNNLKNTITPKLDALNTTVNNHEVRITDLEGKSDKVAKQVAQNTNDIKSLDNKIDNVGSNVLGQSKSYTDTQVSKVGANAAALSALHPLDFNPDDKWQFSAGYGNYKGSNAAAVGAFYQPNENVLLSVGTTLGTGENMINAGATVRFGSHSSMTTNKQVAVAKEVQDLKLQLSAISQKYDNLVKNLSAQKAGQDVDFEYSDLPKDHWAYDFVKKLSDKGYLNGYPDGTFKGDAKMTRYEFAAALWRAVNNGAIIDAQMAKAIKEFEPELEEVNKIMRYRIDTVAGKDNSVHKTERLRVNKNDDPFTHMKRDDYGTKTYTNK